FRELENIFTKKQNKRKISTEKKELLIKFHKTCYKREIVIGVCLIFIENSINFASHFIESNEKSHIPIYIYNNNTSITCYAECAGSKFEA
ncbi:MAG: hypothetical protein IIV19_04595, partial [Bacteroidaceae bacterium]|nr:hypothetical protein [Bacteroidaceae bacterium]